MTKKEIRKHINVARFDICHAIDELEVIHAHMSCQDLLKIKRRLQELCRLFEFEEQEGEE